MRGYIIRRFLLFIPTVIIATIILFALIRFIPGDVIDLMIAEMIEQSDSASTDEELETELRHRIGLDVNIAIQYGRWMGIWPQDSGEFAGVLEGNLGRSFWRNESITTMILERLPITIELGILAIVIAWFVAIPIGIISAIRQDSVFDYGSRSFAIIWVAAPGFWIATMVVVFPAIWWGWTPPVMYIPFSEDPLGNLAQFILPAFIMGMSMSGGIARYGRTMMLEVLRQDYIRTAWAKGLSERTVIVRHALKNALIPIVTILGGEVPMLIAGSVIMEQIFCLPGVGRLVIEALNRRDYPIVSGVNMLMITIVLVTNLFIDILYGFLDPRIRYG
ncbi:ABC transporter permease [Chloroflexota bacterium]